MRTWDRVWSLVALAALCATVGCSSDDGGSSGNGGTAATGVAGVGGAAAMGGLPSGGTTAGTGGAFTAGTGAVPATGGAPATGGMPATGGAGGMPATGGTGGMPATGGTGGMPATGGTGGMPATGGTGGTTGGGPLALTATAFSDGGEIPDDMRCMAPSPELSWTGAPAGTMSFGIVMRDLTQSLIHWVIYDIPATETGLASGVPAGAMPSMPAGAKQGAIDNLVALFVGVDAVSYAGPCAGAGSMNMYQLTLYAVDVAELPGVTAGGAGATVETALMDHAIETATLTFVSIP